MGTVVADSFGQALRQLRMAAGMRQVDLVEALDRVIARSTLANVEVGRENPSARLWQAICTHQPDWVEELQPWYPGLARQRRDPPFEISGPYELVEARYVYTFRDHRAPEEILLVRRVRALSDGADGYGLSLTADTGHFDLDTEPLFGGWIERHERQLGHEGSRVLTRFHFDRTLARGEEHEFATRSWVSHDDPEDGVSVRFSRPTQQATLVMNFLGPRPRLVWRYCTDDPEAPEPTTPRSRRDLVAPRADGSCTLHIEHVTQGRTYGLAWKW